MNNPIKPLNLGLILKSITLDQHLFTKGSLGEEVLQFDGQWDSYLPIYEPQAEYFETDGCTVWGTQNAVEILFKKIYGSEANYSERFTYNMIPVIPPGSDPHTVAECIRKTGLIDNDLLPMTETYVEFTQPVSSVYKAKGKEWVKQFDFGHEWIFNIGLSVNDKPAIMLEALRYSPIGIGVFAWHKNGDLYSDLGQSNNHFCVCFGYKENEYWKIFDSYDQSIKHLEWNFNFQSAKRYKLLKRPLSSNWLVDIIKSILNLWKRK